MRIDRSQALHQRLRGLLLCGLVCVGSAWADVGDSGATNVTTTTSTSRTPDTFTDNPLPDRRIDTYRTRLTGLLQGDATLFYDQTFAAPFGDAAVNAGVSAAMVALTSANSGNPLAFLGPSQVGSLSSLIDSNSTTTQVGEPLVTPTGGLGNTTGPETVLIGDLGNCALLKTEVFPFPYAEGFTSVQDYPFECSGGNPQSFEVVSGTTNINVNLDLQYHFTREIQLTETWELFETWTLIGVADQAETAVSEPGVLWLLLGGLGLAARRGLRRARHHT